MPGQFDVPRGSDSELSRTRIHSDYNNSPLGGLMEKPKTSQKGALGAAT